MRPAHCVFFCIMVYRWLQWFVVIVLSAQLNLAKENPTVIAIYQQIETDLVLIEGGWHTGLRLGIMWQVTRSGKKIGEIMLVELDERKAVGVIVYLHAGESLQPGDSLSVSTFYQPVS